MRECLFCSKKADSLEDAWPHWITDQFRSLKPGKAQLERNGINIWHVYQPELKVRCVCQSCNNGWMSELESQTKIFLQPLLLGERRTLDISGQSTIALWSLKTAMVLEALDQPQKRLYTHHEREQLQILRVIPWRTTVWLSTSVDYTLFLSSKNRYMQNDDANAITGVSITIALAHVVVQVLTIRVPRNVGRSTLVTTNVRRDPWDQATVQIWPVQSALVDWPPPLGLNSEDGLNALAERFSTANLNYNEIDSLTV